MPAKVTERATDYREVDRFEGGVGWIAHPEEIMQRAGHALATDESVYAVDPVDAEGLDDLLAEFGDVTGVVLLSNHHGRDADRVADRHGVPVYLPEPMEDVTEEFDVAVDVERVAVGELLGDYELLEVAVESNWHEFALYDGETLVVSESIGAAPYMRVGDERLGVMLLRRLSPPREALEQLSPERVLSGHGPGVDEDADEALTEALQCSRRRFPRALLENGLQQARTVTAALRS
jgi:hypothetical protein